MHSAWKEAFQKYSFWLRFNVISKKPILVILTFFRKMGKLWGLKKIWKKNLNILTFCAAEAVEQKRVGYLSFDKKYVENCRV